MPARTGHPRKTLVPKTNMAESTNVVMLDDAGRNKIPEDVATVRSSELLAKLEDLDLILRERRLGWFGHVEHSSGAVRTACDIHIESEAQANMEETDRERLP